MTSVNDIASDVVTLAHRLNTTNKRLLVSKIRPELMAQGFPSWLISHIVTKAVGRYLTNDRQPLAFAATDPVPYHIPESMSWRPNGDLSILTACRNRLAFPCRFVRWEPMPAGFRRRPGTATLILHEGVFFVAIAENLYPPPVVLPSLAEIGAEGGAYGRPAHP
jgi:hypothetical protein